MTHTQPSPGTTPLWTAQQVADALNVNRETVLRWAKNNQIPHIKNGRTYRFPPDVAKPQAEQPQEHQEAVHVD